MKLFKVVDAVIGNLDFLVHNRLMLFESVYPLYNAVVLFDLFLKLFDTVV